MKYFKLHNLIVLFLDLEAFAYKGSDLINTMQQYF